jgi:Family of unknown function (DUF6117)
MAIPIGHKANFDTLRRVFRDNAAALLECTDATTGKPVTVVCAVVQEEDGNYVMTPFAKLFDGNPYEEVIPPG